MRRQSETEEQAPPEVSVGPEKEVPQNAQQPKPEGQKPPAPTATAKPDATKSPPPGPWPVAPDRIDRIERNQTGQLVVHVRDHGEPIVDARVARCFPWSVPDCFISVRTKDGKEIALLESLDDLPAASRHVVSEELNDKVFNPRIRRVLSHKREFGVTNITAETDRGEVTFQIRSRDDIRVLSNTRALFRDADGNTYEVTDLDELDPATRRHLHQYF